MTERTLDQALAHAEEWKTLHCQRTTGDDCFYMEADRSAWCEPCKRLYELEMFDNHDLEILAVEILRLREEIKTMAVVHNNCVAYARTRPQF